MPLRQTTTTCGKAQGVPCGNPMYTVFRGIPYAQETSGENRFAPPKPAQPWEGIRICDTFSEICMQTPAPQGMPFADFFTKEFYPYKYACGENSLCLNVWTPAQSADEKLPVMFWIHGGGHGSGYGHEMEFDGEAICRKGVILVTINYRVNYFGFMAHPELSAKRPEGVSGNVGYLDQVAALKWVKENIAFFGGDPKKVTIFGQSAGGMSVLFHLVSDLSEGLFSQAIIQSGAFGMASGRKTAGLEDAHAWGVKACEYIGVTLDELCAMSAADAQQALLKAEAVIGPMPKAIVDGFALKDSVLNLVRAGKMKNVPVIVGSVRGDKDLIRAVSDNSGKIAASERYLAGDALIGLKQSEEGRIPAYEYFFDPWIPEHDVYGFVEDGVPYHSVELWYVFGTLDRCWRNLDGRHHDLSKTMISYWTNFAKTGNPNGEGLPVWEPAVKDHQAKLYITENGQEMRDISNIKDIIEDFC